MLFRSTGEAPETPGAPSTDAEVTNLPAIAWKPVPNAAAYAVARDGVEIDRVKEAAYTDTDVREEGKHSTRSPRSAPTTRSASSASR